MWRKIIIVFLLWFFLLMVPGVGIIVYTSGAPFDFGFLQVVVIECLICLNFLYLFFRLTKLDLASAFIFAGLFSLARNFYLQHDRQTDPRIQGLYFLAALVAITVVFHLVKRKASPQ